MIINLKKKKAKKLIRHVKALAVRNIYGSGVLDRAVVSTPN